jgi:hypothetical protein
MNEQARATPSRGRRVVAALCWLLASVAILFSGVTLWAHQTLLTSSGWAGIVEDVIAEPEVVEEVSTRLVTGVSDSLGVRDTVAGALPGSLDIVAGALTSTVEDRITDLVIDFASSEGFQDAFVRVNELAHDAAMTAIRGGDTEALDSEAGVLTLNLFPLIEGVLLNLQEAGLIDAEAEIPDLSGAAASERDLARLETLLGRELPDDLGTITLIDSENLALVQDIVRWFDLITLVSFLLAVLFAALALWLSSSRIRMLLWLAGGAIAALAAGRLLVRVLLNRITDRAQEGDASVTVLTIIDVAVDSLMWFTFILMAVALVVAAFAWWWERRKTGERPARETPPRTLGRWVRDNARSIILAGLAVIAFLVLWNVGGPDIALITAAAVGLLVIAVAMLSDDKEDDAADTAADVPPGGPDAPGPSEPPEPPEPASEPGPAGG